MDLDSKKPNPMLRQKQIEEMTIAELRKAIRQNWVSFPSQVPTLQKHYRPDLQPKIVQLYFIFGWSCERIGTRYDRTQQWVGQILNIWKKRAAQMGYIQHIPPD
jgi:hypothetical protein